MRQTTSAPSPSRAGGGKRGTAQSRGCAVREANRGDGGRQRLTVTGAGPLMHRRLAPPSASGAERTRRLARCDRVRLQVNSCLRDGVWRGVSGRLCAVRMTMVRSGRAQLRGYSLALDTRGRHEQSEHVPLSTLPTTAILKPDVEDALGAGVTDERICFRATCLSSAPASKTDADMAAAMEHARSGGSWYRATEWLWHACGSSRSGARGHASTGPFKVPRAPCLDAPLSASRARSPCVPCTGAWASCRRWCGPPRPCSRR